MTILSATYHCIPAATRRMLPLAGGIILIGSKPVDAAIVHSGVQNIPIATTFDGVYLDVNTSSNNYALTEFTGWDLNLFFGGLGISNSAGFQPIRSGTGNEDPILRLRLGSSVTSALSVSSGIGGSGADDDSGHVGPAANQFTSGQSGYFGFRLAAASGSIPYFYGWMRATLTSDGTTGFVHEWAYEEGGGSIVTGFSGSVGAEPKTITPGTPVTGSVAAAGTALLMGDPTAAFTFSGGGTYTGVIVGEGTINISGTDGLVLTGTNPFGGTAAVQDGSSLTVSSSGNLGSAEVKLGANSDLVFNPPAAGTSGSTFDNTITIPAPTPITSGIVNGLGFGTGALSSTSGSIVTRDGTGALGTTLVEESAVTLSNTGAKVIDLTGSLAGSGNLLINGGGGFVLAGAVANTFSGLITVSHGNLMLNKSAGVNAIAGNVAVQGGLATGASLTVAASHQIANNAAVSLGAYGSFGFSGSGLTETIGSLTNSGGTFITGANTLIGSGNSISWSGGTNTVSAGGTLTDAHFLISGGTNTVEGGTTRGTLEVASGGSGFELGGIASPVLTLNSHATQAGRILLSGDVSVLSTLTTGTAQILSGGNAATAGFIDLGAGSRTVTVYDGDAATDLLISAGITNGALVKAGTGNLTITGTANYTGTTTISAGVLQIGDSETAGALSSNGGITNNSVLWFKRSNTITQGTDFGTISGTGTLTQAGVGTLILSSANDYSGDTSVNTGILNIRHATALGSTSGATAVASGAALEIQGDISVGAEGLTLNGSGISTGGALRNISGSNDFGGLVTLASSTRIHSDAGTLNLSNAGTLTGTGFALTVGGAGNVSIGSIIGTGSGSLTKEGGGSLTLSGANTYSGATNVAEGILNIRNAAALGSTSGATAVSSGAALEIQGGIIVGAEGLTLNGSGIGSGGALRNISASNEFGGLLTLASSTRIHSDAGTLNLSNSGTITGSGLALTVGGAGNISIGSVIGTESGSLTKEGTGSLTLSGASTYTGTTIISAGTLQVGSSGTIGSLSPSGSITNNSALWFKRSNTITQGVDFGTISGTGSLTQAGVGTLILSSANDYSGDTSVNTGILNIRHATALGSTSGTTAVASGAALEIQGGITIGAEGLTLNGSGISSGGALRNISGSNEFGGLVTLASSARIHSDAGTLNLSNAGTLTGSGFALTVGGAGNVSIGSIIGTGSGSLTKEGAGLLTLNGANTYTGATTIGEGSLVLAAANRLSDDTDVTISSGATFNLNGFAESVASLTGAGNLSLGTGNLTAGGDNTSTTFSGVISGSGGLTKSGSGTLTLSGLSDFSGGIRVESGTLSINRLSALSSAQAMGTGAVDLGVAAVGGNPGSGGTLLYTGGAGTLAQAINILGANSVIRNGGSGVLDILGSITHDSASAFLIDGGSQGIVISSAIQGTTSGISTSGRVQLAGSVLDADAIVDVSGTLIIGGSSGGTIQKVAGLSGSGGIAGSSTSGASFVDVDMATGSNDFSGTIGGGSAAEKNVGLTKSGLGTLILSGASSNTYTALTVVNGGVLSLAKTSNATAIGGDLQINAGTLQIAASNQISNSSQITMTAGSFSFSGSGLTETVETFTNNGGTFVTGANTLIATGSTITWSGGTNTISAGGSTQDGHYLITGGTNTVEGGSSRGSLVVSSGGLGLELGGSSSPVITLNSDANEAGRILLSGNLSVLSTLTAGTAGILSGGSAANPGYIDLDGGVRTFTVNDGSAATDLQISAQLTHGGFTKAGAGTLALSAANTYAGLTTISAGALNIQHASGLGSDAAGTSVASGAALEIQGGITVASESLTLDGGGISSGGALRNISGNNDFAGAIALGGDSRIHSDSGTLTLSASEVTGSGYGLTLGGAGNISISSMIGTGSGTLTKEGAGSITLSGANTYTGATTITAGTLVLNGSIDSPVTVGSGGTLKGVGSIDDDLIVTGHLSPGNGIGTLAVTGTTTFNSGSIFDWNLDISASNPETSYGVAYDTLTTVSVAGSGAILKILLTGTQDFSDVFWNSQRTWSNVFSVTTPSNLATVFSGGVLYSYNGQSAPPTSGSFQVSGSSLTWSLVPEPGNALIGLLLGSVLLRRRREGRPSDETR